MLLIVAHADNNNEAKHESFAYNLLLLELSSGCCRGRCLVDALVSRKVVCGANMVNTIIDVTVFY